VAKAKEEVANWSWLELRQSSTPRTAPSSHRGSWSPTLPSIPEEEYSDPVLAVRPNSILAASDNTPAWFFNKLPLVSTVLYLPDEYHSLGLTSGMTICILCALISSVLW